MQVFFEKTLFFPAFYRIRSGRMRTFGIVAEYNPFHTGHRYHIQKTREQGATHIAVVMSTSFVQRGEPAAFDFRLRANAALENGADLVVALPAVYAMSGAGVFCKAGIRSLSLLGCDGFSFGCETEKADLMTLKEQCAAAITSDIFKANLDKGMHFARARAQAIQTLYGDASALRDANTALALGYLEANESLPFPMEPMVVERVGVSHDAAQPDSDYASASYLRKNPSAWEKYLPMWEAYREADASGKVVDRSLADRILTAVLKTKTEQEFYHAAGVSEGLEHTLYRAVRQNLSAEEILTACKSKRYPMSSLRRMLWSVALGITDALQSEPVEHLWVIAANERGFEMLAKARELRKQREIAAVVTPKFADFASVCPQIAEIEQRAVDLFSLCCPNPSVQNLYRMPILR